MKCDCDLRHRRWNPNTGRCETCRRGYEPTVGPRGHEKVTPVCLAHLEPEPCATCAAYIAAGL
jgi:hypothetical protein